MSNQTVVVKYQTQKIYCPCCNQKLPEIETSKDKEFEISKDTALCWTNWNEYAEYPEDLDSMIPDFIYETIRFFSVNEPGHIILAHNEVEKVKEFILREVIQ